MSSVSRCVVVRATRSYTKRSVKPPVCAENAIDLPSGDQAGLEDLAEVRELDLLLRRRRCRRRRSRAPAGRCGPWRPRAAGPSDPRRRPTRGTAGSRSADRTPSRRACGSPCPVVASARYRSIDSWSRSERNAIRVPSGLSAGPTFMPPLPVRSPMTQRTNGRRLAVGRALARVRRRYGSANRRVPVARTARRAHAACRVHDFDRVTRSSCQPGRRRRDRRERRRGSAPTIVVALACRRCTPRTRGRSGTGSTADRRGP